MRSTQNVLIHAAKNARPVPQNAHEGAFWPEPLSEKPGAARGDPEEARKGVNGLKPEPTAQYPETIESRR